MKISPNFFLLLLLVFLGIILSILESYVNATPLLSIRVDSESGMLLDSLGRVRFFHGLNVVEKSFPFYPTDRLSEERMKYFSSWGFNAIRLGTMWAGGVPQKDQFNETYFQILSTIVQKLESYGIYSLLDCHQDVMSPKFCGEGFPDWASIPSPDAYPFAEPVHEKMKIDNKTGYPEGCGNHIWASYYLADQTTSAFQNLYDNNYGLRTAFGNFWKKVASTFVKYDSILGYELINEPFPGDIYRNPLYLLPGFGDYLNLQPMYFYLNEQIRTIDDTHIIFYEPITWDVTPTGFTSVPGGNDYVNRSVLSWHFYCWTFDENNMNPINWGFCDTVLSDDYFGMRVLDREKLGGASFLTEFGLCTGESSNSKRECENVMNQADRFMQSWTYWDYDFFDGKGKPILDIVKTFSRTYAPVISGMPLSIKFNPNTSDFELVWRKTNAIINQTDASGDTEIFVPEQFYYPNGYQFEITPSNTFSVKQEPSKLILTYNSNAKQNQVSRLTISRK